MKIGIDIDDVVTETFKKYLEVYNEKYSDSVGFEELTSFYLWDVLDASKEELIGWGDEIIEEGYEVVGGAIEGVKSLGDENELVFVTSRPERHKSITEKFINENFGDLKVFYSGGIHESGISKAEIILKEKVDILIEDASHYALDCACNGIKVLLFDKPWNQGVEHNNIMRVKNWGEILEKIKEIESDFGGEE